MNELRTTTTDEEAEVIQAAVDYVAQIENGRQSDAANSFARLRLAVGDLLSARNQ